MPEKLSNILYIPLKKLEMEGKLKNSKLTHFLNSPVQAIKRILAAYPLNPQSQTESPFFDHNNFQYDEKVVSSTDRARLCSEFSVKWYSRETGRFLFQIDSSGDETGVTNRTASK